MSNEQGMSKRQLLREKRRREEQRNRWIVTGVIVIVALILVFFIVWPMIKPAGPFTSITPRPRPNVNDNSMGNADAPITITEYSDYQCPFCRRFWNDTEDQLMQAYVATGKARFIYRSFGGFIGAESQAAAEAAYCAGDQGKFWEMHDIIFTNQAGENAGTYTSRKLQAFATSIGLDMNQFNSCVNSNKYASRVAKDGTDAVTAGVQATPTFIITYVVDGVTKTRKVEGAQPFSAFQTEIDAALAEMGLK